ncbi:unnamed protein product [Musa textilis]
MESSYEVGAVAKDKASEINPEEDGINIRSDMSALKPGYLIYHEAQKHLTEMLDTGDPRASLPTAHVSESLGSHGSDRELVLPYEETGSLPMQQFHQEDATGSLSLMKQSLELSPRSSGNQTDGLLLDSKAETTENHMQEGLCIGSELNLEASAQNVGTAGISKLLPNPSDVPLEPKSNDEDVSLEVESHAATHSGSRGSLREILETPESTTAVIPTLDTGARARFNLVKAVIEASGLSTTDFSERCHLGDELLARSLFDEVEISSSPRIDDPKLLFDCINEALEEIFKCPPWVVSLITSNVQQAPGAQSLIREVSGRIERQISTHLPNSLGQMVMRDLESGSRLELHSETKNIVDEIWDTLLDDLVDETIFDLWLDHSAGW